MKTSLAAASLALASLLASAPALADLAPPGGAAGVAGSESGGSGGSAGQGGAGSSAGGSSAAGSATSGQAGATVTGPAKTEEEDSGCSVSGAGRQGALAGLMLGLGALVLLLDRRTRR